MAECVSRICFVGKCDDMREYRAFLKSLDTEKRDKPLSAIWTGLELPEGDAAKSGISLDGTFRVSDLMKKSEKSDKAAGFITARSEGVCIDAFILARDALSIPLKLDFSAESPDIRVTSSYAFRPKYSVLGTDGMVSAKDDAELTGILMGMFGDHGIDVKAYKAIADAYAKKHGRLIQEASLYDMRGAERKVHDLLMEY